jgi:hypothetical protein
MTRKTGSQNENVNDRCRYSVSTGEQPKKKCAGVNKIQTPTHHRLGTQFILIYCVEKLRGKDSYSNQYKATAPGDRQSKKKSNRYVKLMPDSGDKCGVWKKLV